MKHGNGVRTICAFLGAAALTAAGASVARAGGPEYDCTTGVAEAWPTVPADGVPWVMARETLANGRIVAAGYPGFTCSFPAGNWKRPGAQSAVAAARAWTRTKIPLPGPIGIGPPVGQNVGGIGGGQSTTKDATTFAFRNGPAGWFLQTGGASAVNLGDGQNVVSVLEPAGTFGPGGSFFTLGIAFVSLVPGTRDIDAFDIVLNAGTTDGAGRPAWSFVEVNTTDGRTHAGGPTTVATLGPVSGYADLQGVLTHEFGHAAGLGHSLVESEFAGGTDRLPTMFPYAPPHPFTATADNTPGCTATTFTATGQLLGAGAQTLEWDDVAAIGEAYPAAPFNSLLGKIAGTIHAAYITVGSFPYRGAHVTAIKADDPAVVRVSTLSMNDGSYVIRGLPEGDYYVHMEIPDGPNGLSTAPYFSSAGDLPEFVDVGCTSFAVPYHHEFYSDSEINPITRCESQANSRALPVTVTAGATTGGIDILTATPSTPGVPLTGTCCNPIACTQWEEPFPLFVGPVGGGLSARGLIIAPGSGASFLIQAPSSYDGLAVDLLFSTVLSNTLDAGGLLTQVGGAPLVVLPGITTMGSAGSGLAGVTLLPFSAPPLPTTSATIFVQARIVDPGSGATIFLSNMVNVTQL